MEIKELKDKNIIYSCFGQHRSCSLPMSQKPVNCFGNSVVEFVGWSLAPLTWMLSTLLRVLQHCNSGTHLVLWPVLLTIKFCQLLACIQVTFFLLTFLKMAWSLFFIALCRVSAFVESHDGSNSLADFLRRYYNLDGARWG